MTRILHILREGPQEDVLEIIKAQAEQHEVEVVDLSKPEFSYDEVVDKIAACDKVLSW